MIGEVSTLINKRRKLFEDVSCDPSLFTYMHVSFFQSKLIVVTSGAHSSMYS